MSRFRWMLNQFYWWWYDRKHLPREFMLDLVPKFMRSWPVLQRWYWQAEEVAEIKARAEVQWKEFSGE